MMTQPGWQNLLKIASDIEKSLYPNPKDYKTTEELTLQYTFARGGTELLKQLLSILARQEAELTALVEKQQGKRKFRDVLSRRNIKI